jgi:hypothetical protein
MHLQTATGTSQITQWEKYAGKEQIESGAFGDGEAKT